MKFTQGGHARETHTMQRACKTFWIGLLVLLFDSNCMADTLTLTTEDYPPFNVKAENGKPVSGLSTDIITEMMKRADIAITIDMYP